MTTPKIQIIPSEDDETCETRTRIIAKSKNQPVFSSGSNNNEDASVRKLSPQGDDVIDDVRDRPNLTHAPIIKNLGYSSSRQDEWGFTLRRNSDSQAFVSEPNFKAAMLSLEHSGGNRLDAGDGSFLGHDGWNCNQWEPTRRRSYSCSQVYDVQEETSNSTAGLRSAPITPLGRMATRNYYENKIGLAEDLKFISRMPELCDVTFLVGERREPVCAVRAILGARSRVFHKLLYSSTVTPSSSPRRRANSMESRFARKTVSFLTRSKSNGDPDGGNSATKCPRTVLIEEFESSVFAKLVEYCHTGCVLLNAETVLGLMNAADYYGLDELRRACIEYMHNCLDLSTVCLLLTSAEKYIQYKATKTLVQRALEFVDENGDDVLRLPAFLKLPQHVVRLVLSRDELKADELTKFQAALAWSTLHFRNTPGTSIKGAMSPFIDTIAFHLIPATDLMQEVRESGVVPDHKIMTALAFQVDPESVDTRALSATPNRVRLSMLSLSLDDRSSLTSDALGSCTAYTERTDFSDEDGSLSDDRLSLRASSPVKSPEFRRLSTVDSDDGQTWSRTDQILEESGFDNPSQTLIISSLLDNTILEDVSDYHPQRPQSADELSTANSLNNFDCISMSTSSDVTDSSSGGGSFGRADQKMPTQSVGSKSSIHGVPF